MREITEQMQLTEEQTKAYQQSVVSTVGYMVSCRCELDGDMKISGGLNLNAVDLFRDTRDLIRFCDLVQRTAKDSLLEMEREVFQILNQRRERAHEIEPDRSVSDRNAVHGQPAGTGAPAPTPKMQSFSAESSAQADADTSIVSHLHDSEGRCMQVVGTCLGTWPEKCCKIQKNLSEYGNIFQKLL